jgi:hypothetical protein
MFRLGPVRFNRLFDAHPLSRASRSRRAGLLFPEMPNAAGTWSYRHAPGIDQNVYGALAP